MQMSPKQETGASPAIGSNFASPSTRKFGTTVAGPWFTRWKLIEVVCGASAWRCPAPSVAVRSIMFASVMTSAAMNCPPRQSCTGTGQPLADPRDTR